MAITTIPPYHLSGRSILRTDLTTFTAETLKEDLKRVLPQHKHNREQIRMLQDYVRGWHPAIQMRQKTTRTDVDNKITVNYALSITRDIVGYFLGKPIQYTHRRGTYRRQMDAFLSALHAENKGLVDYQVATDCSICGVGYRGIFVEPYPRNGTTLKLMRLDPLDTFVVYPSDPVQPPAYAVTTYETQGDVGATVYYKVYTPDMMYVFKENTSVGLDTAFAHDLELVSQTRIYFGGGLPIVEYTNNMWRLGDWETAISIMDAIDAVTSDGVNDIQQAVNAVLVVLGADMDEETFAKLSTHGFLAVSDIPVGVKPEIKFISEAMDARVGESLREYLEATLRVVVGVPDRKSRPGGGGDTGDAVFMRDGWQDIDLVAASKEPYFIQAEREALKVMLYILDTAKEVAHIDPADIEIHFNRNKTANLQSKAQVFQTLINTGLAPVDALDIANLTNNIHDVILRMEDFAAKREAKRIQPQDSSNGAESNSVAEGGSEEAGAE